MLQLQQTFTGYPAAGLQFIRLPTESLLLYPSADAIIIRNVETLALKRILTFWEAFPGTIHANDAISCISVDSGMKLIIAAMNTRIVAWSLSEVKDDAWRIHSTLVLQGDGDVLSLDNKAGLLAVGTTQGLSIYTLVMDNDLPTWSLKWSTTVGPVIHASFAPSLMYIATVSKSDTAIHLYSTTSGRQTQTVPHPRPVVKITWRRPLASSRDDLILYTITSDAVLRIFLPVLDAPEYLQLHASLDLYSSLPYSVAADQSSSASTVFWLDRLVVGKVIDHILKHQLQQDDGRKRRIREIQEEGWDLFLRVLADGSIVVTALANVDRRPPTLLRTFTLQQSQPCLFSSPPSYLYLLPNSDPTMLTLVTSTPLMTFHMSPLAFFDAQSHGLEFISSFPHQMAEKEDVITRLLRTPEGQGIGVLRANGTGEAYTVTKRGTELKQCGKWIETDFAVTLWKGHRWATYQRETGVLTLHTDPVQTLSLPELENLFTMPSPDGCEFIIAISHDFTVIQIMAMDSPNPQLSLVSQSQLPVSSPLRFIQPVDPMAWGSSKREWTAHDVLLSVTLEGELAFWAPDSSNGSPWRCTGQIRTERSGFRKAKCSSMKKTALVVEKEDAVELTIWDSTVSEFSTGLEYHELGRGKDRILDLDWSSTTHGQSILAVGYAHHVELLCQRRSTYFDGGPGWSVCQRIDIQKLTPYPISDSIWASHGSFLISAGRHMFLYSDPLPDKSEQDPQEGLFEQVARLNGPLEDFHPQMLLQCLLWEKIEVAKEIICGLTRDILRHDRLGYIDQWTALPTDRFLQSVKPKAEHQGNRKKQYTSLFANGTADFSDDEEFSRASVSRLITYLEQNPLSHLTPNEQAHLVVLIQTTVEIDEQRRALDASGLRYLISMRSFYITNQRADATNAQATSGKRERLRYRDMVWAFHSESQDLLVNASASACNNKMTWSDAKALGLALWLTSPETLKQQLEVIARNEYMAGGDARDPTACSIYYFALGKQKLVQGLWRQSSWHREHGLMIKFLNNDFSQARWKTAALKNAYVLIGKQRYEYAAAFFLLGGSLKDAVNVCLRHLKDFQLAIALARVVEQKNSSPIIDGILRDTVLPTAFQLGNRWLASWTFWQLNRRDLAVRVLLTPLRDIAPEFGLAVEDIKEPLYDDPSLALIYAQLRDKTLQTVKGSIEISGRFEFNFVLQMARVFCRMGCHVMALDLVRSWTFSRPPIPVHPAITPAPHSPVMSKFSLEQALNRRTSVIMDIDIANLVPVEEVEQGLTSPTEKDMFARKTGLGNLMKAAKQTAQVPDFDMNAFF